MSYYATIRSLDELLGYDGILRLPPYLSRAFILDQARADAIEFAIQFEEWSEYIVGG